MSESLLLHPEEMLESIGVLYPEIPQALRFYLHESFLTFEEEHVRNRCIEILYYTLVLEVPHTERISPVLPVSPKAYPENPAPLEAAQTYLFYKMKEIECEHILGSQPAAWEVVALLLLERFEGVLWNVKEEKITPQMITEVTGVFRDIYGQAEPLSTDAFERVFKWKGFAAVVYPSLRFWNKLEMLLRNEEVEQQVLRWKAEYTGFSTVYNEEIRNLENIVEDEEQCDVETLTNRLLLYRAIEETLAISTLNPENVQIFRESFGLGTPELTDKEIAKKHGKLKEAVQRRRAKILAVFRSPIFNRKFREFR